MKLTHLSTLFCVLFAQAPMTLAHEFWIEPIEFQVQKDQKLEADLKNGEFFKGSRQSFFANRNTSFQAVLGENVTPISGRMGDRPAIQLPPPTKKAC